MTANRRASRGAGRSIGATVRAVLHALRDRTFPNLTVLLDRPGRLILNASGNTVVASRHERTVTVNGAVVATFDELEAIHVQYFLDTLEDGNDANQRWTLNLKPTDRRKIKLGTSTDALEMSLVAAHLATLLGKPVVTLDAAGQRSTDVGVL